MTSQTRDLRSRTAAAQSRVRLNMAGKPLRIAVLGPNLEEIQETGTVKRYQIRDALKDDGHSPFFPEDCIDENAPTLAWLTVERQMLSDDSVDLIIILHTEKSFGVLTEIGNFQGIPEIQEKTAILFPSRFYTPDESLPANTVQDYHAKKLYTDDEMNMCHLVGECRYWARVMQIGAWTDLERQRF